MTLKWNDFTPYLLFGDTCGRGFFYYSFYLSLSLSVDDNPQHCKKEIFLCVALRLFSCILHYHVH